MDRRLWSDSDSVHLMRIARDVIDGYLDLDEALDEFNNGAELKRTSLRSLEARATTLAKKLSKVNSPKAKATVASLKKFANRSRVDRRRRSWMAAGNALSDMSMKPRKITDAEKLQLKTKLKKLTPAAKLAKKSDDDLEQRIAKLESMIGDIARNVSHMANQLSSAFEDLF